MNNIHGTDLMNWEAIKKIYMEVLVRGARIEYMGHGECETVRLFNENLISIKYNEFNYYRYVDYAIKYFNNNKYTKRSYYQDGTKKWKTQYKNNLRHGISVGWNYAGRKIYNQKYINGVPIPMKGGKMSNMIQIIYNFCIIDQMSNIIYGFLFLLFGLLLARNKIKLWCEKNIYFCSEKYECDDDFFDFYFEKDTWYSFDSGKDIKIGDTRKD
ncbi:hypothetical protein LCGC14_2298650, partial [marine sediment metagenome]